MDHRKPNGKVRARSSSPIRRNGSMRKVLHSSQGTADTMLCVSAKILERSENKNPSVHAYATYLQEYSLMSEFKLIGSHLHPGLFVIPAAYSKYLWFGVIFVTSGIYDGGMFRFSIHLSKNFPDSKCPRVLFETPVYHPNIDEETMELNLSEEFYEWRKEVNHVWQVLDYLHGIFYSIDEKAPVNLKAHHMYLNDRDTFDKSVKECVDLSQKLIYDTPSNDDPHYFKFEIFNSKVHGEALEKLTSQKASASSSSPHTGYSWIELGTLETFSKPYSQY